MKNPAKEFNKIQKNNTEKRCANQRSELFSLNNKVLQQKYEIKQQQAEINRLRKALEGLTESFDSLKSYYPQTYLFVEDCKRRIKQALNVESEEK